MLAGAATLWIFLVACWGICGPFPDGHFAATAGIGVAGRNMWVFKTLYPVLRSMAAPLIGSPYYMNHPLGDFWVAALVLKVFGEHNWVLRLPAVVYSTLTPILLYRYGRAAWGPMAGGFSALAYVSLPITLGFANFHALEGPVIFGLALCNWGYARFVQTERSRYVVLSLFGFLWAVNHDWHAYLWGALFVSWLFFRAFVVPLRVFGQVPVRAFARYWGLMCAVAILSLVVTFDLIISSGKLHDVIGMYGARSSGNTIPMRLVLEARHVWIEMMFTGLGIALGKLAALILVVRFLIKRNELDLLPLLILMMAVVHYLHFKQGADVHIFWPQYFAPFFAMGVGAMLASLRDGLAWLNGRSSRAWLTNAARQAPWVAAAILALPVLAILRDGASTIRLARETGGRYNSPMIQSEVDKVIAFRWFIARAKALPTDKIAFHTGLAHVSWTMSWELRPHQLLASQPAEGRAAAATARFFFLDTRYATTEEMKQLAKNFQVHAVGPYWLIDRSAPAALLEGYSFNEREPGPWDWYFQGGTEPLRDVRPDGWMTWEWRTALDQNVVPPIGEPRTLEQCRVAYNVAVVGKDADRAAKMRAEVDRWLNLKITAKYDNGAELIGLYHHLGAERSVTAVFLGGPFKGRAKFAINSKVDARRYLSTLPLDKNELDLAPPPMVHTQFWKVGLLYSARIPYRKRPGAERFFGWFAKLDGNPAPARVGEPAKIDLLRFSRWY